MRKLSLLIAILIGLSIFSFPAFAADGFPDMKDHWASASVNVLAEKGIIAGWDGKFHPAESVKANEYIKMVVTALGYTDIQNYPGDWARNYIEKASALGLVLPAEIADYREPINRGMMAKIAMRALQDEVVPDYIMAYKGLVSDYNDLDANIRMDALKCIEKGIIKGMPDGSFRPDYLSTRAEAATVIHRMISQEEREKAKPIFATPDPEFEAFMASDEAENYCSVENIYKVIDGKVIFGGEDYQSMTGEVLVPVWHNQNANKEAYELFRNLVMYARENDHYVKIFCSSSISVVFVKYYENKFYSGGTSFNIETTIWLVPYKYISAKQKEDSYYSWEIGNLAKQSTEDWEAVNYRDQDMTKAVEIACKTIYGNELGQKVFNFAIGEYDLEKDYYFRRNKSQYSNFFVDYREDLDGLEIANYNHAEESKAIIFTTNRKTK